MLAPASLPTHRHPGRITRAREERDDAPPNADDVAAIRLSASAAGSALLPMAAGSGAPRGSGNAHDAGAGQGAQGASLGAGGSGGGNGSGISGAYARYGSNPPPPYPERARRRGEQGTVTLHVLVAADGAVEHVELAASSGFDSLDRSALETIRARWRFVPARRDGVAVESWVLVPIRFTLTEASAQ
jgi:periplasmic protein TonB